MKKKLLVLSIILSTQVLSPLVHAFGPSGSQEKRRLPLPRYIHDFHTIESLASLTEVELFELIQAKVISLPCVPNGESAGIPGRINKKVIRNENFTKFFLKGIFDLLGNHEAEFVASQIWKGKIFSRENCGNGKGINKIFGEEGITLSNRILSLKEYQDDFGRFFDSNEVNFVRAMERSKKSIYLVELNYSQPERDFLHLGKNFGVRDIMVPIKGQNGVIYIGRAYTGTWIKPTQFKSTGLVAWFFLDFSPQAVIDQNNRNQ